MSSWQMARFVFFHTLMVHAHFVHRLVTIPCTILVDSATVWLPWICIILCILFYVLLFVYIVSYLLNGLLLRPCYITCSHSTVMCGALVSSLCIECCWSRAPLGIIWSFCRLGFACNTLFSSFFLFFRLSRPQLVFYMYFFFALLLYCLGTEKTWATIAQLDTSFCSTWSKCNCIHLDFANHLMFGREYFQQASNFRFYGTFSCRGQWPNLAETSL